DLDCRVAAGPDLHRLLARGLDDGPGIGNGVLALADRLVQIDNPARVVCRVRDPADLGTFLALVGRGRVHALLGWINRLIPLLAGVVERRRQQPATDRAVVSSQVNRDAEILQLLRGGLNLVVVAGSIDGPAIGRDSLLLVSLPGQRLRLVEDHGHRVPAQLGTGFVEHSGQETGGGLRIETYQPLIGNAAGGAAVL